MKTFVNYLRENGKCTMELFALNQNTCSWDDVTVSVEMTEAEYVITINTEEAHFPKDMDIEDVLQEYLYYKHKLEVRFCEECGRPYDKGYTIDGGFWYCCEDCFNTAMDSHYGADKWRASQEEGADGGWYEYLNDEGKWEDTGVYYTEWN